MLKAKRHGKERSGRQACQDFSDGDGGSGKITDKHNVCGEMGHWTSLLHEL
jgi:hypothetical protein